MQCVRLVYTGAGSSHSVALTAGGHVRLTADIWGPGTRLHTGFMSSIMNTAKKHLMTEHNDGH